MIKHTLAITALATASLAALAVPTPAMAQGAVTKMSLPENSGCPKGWQKSKRGSDTTYYCYPTEDSKPAYPKQGSTKCADGYEQQSNFCVAKDNKSSSSASGSSGGAVYQPLARGSFKKRDAADRCPVGYWTTQDDINTCASPSSAKIPATRLKGSSACGADEVDEWGLYCTSKTTTMTRSEAEDIAAGDVNNYYVLSGGGNHTQGYDYKNTPGIIGIYGSGGGAQASSTGSDNGTDATETKTAVCDTSGNGSATGAAVGGAVAGDAGAVLGSVLGGLGKKKKKKAAGC
jgi:hypothetical protein